MAEKTERRRKVRQLQTRVARHGSWNDDKQQRFLEELVASLNIMRSAAAVGMSPQAVYQYRRRSPQFDDAVRAAIDAGIDQLEMELLKAAINGLDQPIIYRGQETGRARRRSERVMMFLLRAHRPEIYDPAAFRRRASAGEPPAPAIDPEEMRARILQLMEEMDAREAEEAIEMNAGRIGD